MDHVKCPSASLGTSWPRRKWAAVASQKHASKCSDELWSHATQKRLATVASPAFIDEQVFSTRARLVPPDRRLFTSVTRSSRK
eukprot:6192665-Pleurochrysis_carterae.AAC.4